jgi:hypothetical protein
MTIGVGVGLFIRETEVNRFQKPTLLNGLALLVNPALDLSEETNLKCMWGIYVAT